MVFECFWCLFCKIALFFFHSEIFVVCGSHQWIMMNPCNSSGSPHLGRVPHLLRHRESQRRCGWDTVWFCPSAMPTLRHPKREKQGSGAQSHCSKCSKSTYETIQSTYKVHQSHIFSAFRWFRVWYFLGFPESPKMSVLKMRTCQRDRPRLATGQFARRMREKWWL